MEPQKTSSSKSIVWIIVLVILIGLATYFVIGRANGNPTSGTEPATFNNQSQIVNSIEVKDQLPGNAVIVSNIALNTGAFVVVQQAQKGFYGTVIGAKFFERGERPAVIPVNPATQAGQSYMVGLYKDDGDGKFDVTKDTPIKDSAGYAILQSFNVVKELPDIKG